MSRVKELEKAVQELNEEEYREFRERFLEHDWKKWDLEIESDSKSGKLDFLIEEAHEAKKRGELKDL